MEGEIYHPNYTSETEMSNFIKVWISVVVSLCYCYYFSAKFIPKGMPRLFSLLPIVSLFFALPLKLHSTNIGANTAFFIAWLANFKLLLFAFGKGPLSNPSLSLLHFIAIACFPIKIQTNLPPKSPSNLQNSLTKSQNRDNPYPLDHQDGQNSQNRPPNGQNGENSYPKMRDGAGISYPLDQDRQNTQNPPPNGQNQNGENPYPRITQKEKDMSIWSYAMKVVMFCLFLRIYEYSDRIHPKVILVLYCVHLYIVLEIMLAVAAAMARALFGFELEPPFDEPYLATSLQDFWGRRWNLVVSRILRPTVYEPVLFISMRILGRKWAALPAVMCTFVVSGLMHELMLYYIGRVQPTWEITWFFLLHGACLVVEIGIKKVVKDKCRLPRVIATPMTVGFVMVTGFWLFFPQFLRCKADVRALEEYALVGAFVKDVVASVVKLGNFGAMSVQ